MVYISQTPSQNVKMRGPLKIFSGETHKEFAEEICRNLSIGLSPSQTIRFSNENMMVKLLDNVRESDAFVIQSSCPPVSDRIIETFLFLDALKNSSAARVTAVLPYFPYVRSDKRISPEFLSRQN